MTGQAVTAELLAVVVAMVDGRPSVLTLGDPPRLPAGPLLPSHRSLQAATRAWVEEQTGRRLGYLEQLYTFADLDRDDRGRRISISYLGLTTPGEPGIGGWTAWYDLFAWEDHRGSSGEETRTVVERLREWADADPEHRDDRLQRVAISFGLGGRGWQPELTLQRYELLYEAGLVPEAPEETRQPDDGLAPGGRMLGDHRRALATGVARLRAKIGYRPVVFELMPAAFTLRQLQDCVEALSGHAVHTQNFRRLIEQQDLVEDTGALLETGGRPARLYRFRRQVLQERQVAGTKLPTARGR
ncbi:NUDIX hydrolase [Propionicimonas sp.]|uniref:NUDIX hydrolase n=1 Tax=Propionicimonas sp. TaxID=1955623 RepID=UPI0039E725EF